MYTLQKLHKMDRNKTNTVVTDIRIIIHSLLEEIHIVKLCKKTISVVDAIRR